MAVWSEAPWLARLAGGHKIQRRRYRAAPATPHEGRQLAATMLTPPAQFTDRLPPRTVQRIIAAAAGRTKLRMVLVALGMDGDRVEHLPRYR
jgi:hypothetical protein